MFSSKFPLTPYHSHTEDNEASTSDNSLKLVSAPYKLQGPGQFLPKSLGAFVYHHKWGNTYQQSGGKNWVRIYAKHLTDGEEPLREG